MREKSEFASNKTTVKPNANNHGLSEGSEFAFREFAHLQVPSGLTAHETCSIKEIGQRDRKRKQVTYCLASSRRNQTSLQLSGSTAHCYYITYSENE